MLEDKQAENPKWDNARHTDDFLIFVWMGWRVEMEMMRLLCCCCCPFGRLLYGFKYRKISNWEGDAAIWLRQHEI